MKRMGTLASIAILAFLAVLAGGVCVSKLSAQVQSPDGRKLVSTRSSLPSAKGTQTNLPTDQFLKEIPATFEPNVGQVAGEIAFISRVPGARLSFEPGQVLIALPADNFAESTIHPDVRNSREPNDSSKSRRPLVFRFPGSNRDTEISGVEPLQTKSNYYIGGDPAQWRTNVTNYAKLRYHDMYPGIDLLFHGERAAVEYDFIVAPGADPREIRMRIAGADGPVHLVAGAVEVPVGGAALRFSSPEVFQLRDGRRERVRGRFVKLGAKTLGFRIAAYDRTRPLVIDPTLSYATFLSGSQESNPVGVAADSAGEIYVAGSTLAIDFPVAAAYQSANGGTENAYISKISSSGTSLVFSTYIGGNSFDTGAGLALDTQNNAYLLGNTTSSNFPTTTGAFRTACPTGALCSAPVVAKFSPTGALIFSTLLSPGANGAAIAVDALGNTYITGAINFPGLDLVNAFEPQYQGITSTSTGNGFVQELNASGTALVYSTYLAGVPGSDGIVNTIGLGIAVDSSGSAYVTGNSTPANFPTPNLSPTLNANRGLFVAKFTPNGSGLIFAASISGSGTDTAYGIALDPSNNVYVTGSAGSTDFPVTSNAFQAACAPAGSALCQNPQVFALEVSADGSTLLYSTLLGVGNPGGIAVDSSGRAYITGDTAQPNFPTLNPIQATFQSNGQTAENAFVTALDSSGNPFFSTFLGGASDGGYGTAITVNPTGSSVYLVGQTAGGDFPMVNPVQTFTCCSGAGFVASIDMVSAGPALSVSPRYAPFLYVRNVSSTPLNITSFASSDPTPLAGDCLPPQTLAPGGFCLLVAGGVVSSQQEPSFTLTVTSDAPGSPSQFQISENTSLSAAPDYPILITSAPALYFGYQLLGTASQPQTVTLTNIGQMPSTINSISVDSSAMNLTNNCPAILAANTSCSIQVVFAPTTLSTIGGTISISHETSNQQISIAASGTPVAGAIQVSTQSIEFGSQYIGLNYLPRTVVLTNVSSNSVSLTSITPSSGYSETDTCSTPLPAGGACRVFVSFAPAGNGEIQGTLTVAYNAIGSQVIVQLDGTGLIRSDLSISPLQLVFGGAGLIGGVQGPQTVTLQNTSTNTLTISSISLTPSVFFISANTCLSPLASGASCTLNVSFMPTSAGPVSGTLTIANTGMGSPQIMSVSGTGTPQLTLSGEANFTDQEVGTTSGLHPVGATNNVSSTTSVTVTGVSVSGDFQLVQGGPGTIPPGFGTAYQVTFTPTATGPRTGTLTVVASDSTSPHQLTLTGNGVAVGAEVSPSSLAFGDLFAGSTSGAQNATITNVSGAAVQIQSVTVSGPFAQTNTCGTSIAAAASCNVMVTFSPVILGSVSGQLTIQDNAAGSPQVVSLSGTGTGPAIKLSPTSIDFPSWAVGTVTAATPVTLTNQADTALAISSISVTGVFAQTNNCGASLAPGISCIINVTFSPTADGLQSGVLSISDSGPNSPQTISLSGIGTPQPSVTLSSTTLNFGTVLVNGANTLSLALTPANAPLTIQGITFSSSEFQQQNQCIPTLGVGVPCTFLVTFDPTTVGNVSATMQFHDDASNTPQSVQITGSGTDFILQAAGGNGQKIAPGGTGTFLIAMSSVLEANETVSLQCSVTPGNVPCISSPLSVPLTGNSIIITDILQIASGSSSFPNRPMGHGRFGISPSYAVAVIATALLLLLWMIRHSVFSARLRGVFCVLLLITLAIGLVSCAGGSGPSGASTGPAPGTYTLTITGTSSNPANPPQTVQFTFTVD